MEEEEEGVEERRREVEQHGEVDADDPSVHGLYTFTGFKARSVYDVKLDCDVMTTTNNC